MVPRRSRDRADDPGQVRAICLFHSRLFLTLPELSGYLVVYTEYSDARTSTIFLERNPRTSLCPVAQPLPALAHGNLFRPEDGQDWLCRILGVHGAGEEAASPLPEVDGRDGQLRAAEAEESIALSSQPKNICRRFPLMDAYKPNPLYRKGRKEKKLVDRRR